MTMVTTLPSRFNGTIDNQCSICLDDFNNNTRPQMVGHIANANTVNQVFHGFHEGCLNRWLEQHRDCPNCRTPLSSWNMQIFNTPVFQLVVATCLAALGVLFCALVPHSSGIILAMKYCLALMGCTIGTFLIIKALLIPLCALIFFLCTSSLRASTNIAQVHRDAQGFNNDALIRSNVVMQQHNQRVHQPVFIMDASWSLSEY
jgi:hypothetical protein